MKQMKHYGYRPKQHLCQMVGQWHPINIANDGQVKVDQIRALISAAGGYLCLINNRNVRTMIVSAATEDDVDLKIESELNAISQMVNEPLTSLVIGLSPMYTNIHNEFWRYWCYGGTI